MQKGAKPAVCTEKGRFRNVREELKTQCAPTLGPSGS